MSERKEERSLCIKCRKRPRRDGGSLCNFCKVIQDDEAKKDKSFARIMPQPDKVDFCL